LPGVERAEDVLDVIGVEGEGFGVIFADRRGQLQMITIDGRVAGLPVRFDPLPCAECDEGVAA
jgi:hypothetical protein